VAEERKRVRHQDRRANTLGRACRNQNRRRRRQCASQRSGCKDTEAGHEDFLGAEAIAQCASGQNERRKSDSIGADDPLQFGHAAAQRRTHAVQGSVHDGDIELNDAVAETHRGKRQLLCRSGLRFHRAGHRAIFVERRQNSM
jgi:hypothetical protein